MHGIVRALFILVIAVCLRLKTVDGFECYNHEKDLSESKAACNDSAGEKYCQRVQVIEKAEVLDRKNDELAMFTKGQLLRMCASEAGCTQFHHAGGIDKCTRHNYRYEDGNKTTLSYCCCSSELCNAAVSPDPAAASLVLLVGVALLVR